MIEAEHMCMSLRGVEKPGALTVTTHFTGAFREEANEQVAFYFDAARGATLSPASNARRHWPINQRSRKAWASRRNSARTG